MAAVQDVLFTRMNAVSALTSLIGSSPCRAYYGLVGKKDPTAPYLLFFRVSEDRESAMGADIGIVDARFQFSIFGDNADSVHAVAEALRGALQRWQPGSTVTPAVHDVFFLSRQDLYEDDTKLHHAAIDYRVIHGE